MEPIDLDHNATSPLDPEVFEAMRPFWFAGGNAGSRHAAGRAARRAIREATEAIGRALGAHPDEVIVTSGGTEANNLAIFGLSGRDGGPGHVVSSPIEHPAVAAPVEALEKAGFTATRPAVSAEGLADPEAMAEAAFTPRGRDTRLATLILAHNETGAIQPVAAMAERFRARGAAGRPVPIHTDAVQAVGRIPVDFHGLGVDTLAAGAHKFGGPPGVGLLLVRRGSARLAPLLVGGGQQRGLRPGTVPVALAVGMAAALEIRERESATRIGRWLALRDRLESGLRAALGAGVVFNGPRDPSQRLPQTVHASFPGRSGDALLMQLDQAGVRASLGSACASGTTRPSPSLLAMRLPEDRLRASVRFSFGAGTTEAEIDDALARIVAAVRRAEGLA